MFYIENLSVLPDVAVSLSVAAKCASFGGGILFRRFCYGFAVSGYLKK
jgi:hypothetical protein